MIRSLVILCFLLVGVPLVPVQQHTHSAFAQETYSGGMSLMLAPADGQWRDPDRPDLFQLASGTPLRATVGFLQSYPETKPFRIFVLLNYQQASIGVQEIPNPDDAQAGVATPTMHDGPLQPFIEFEIPPNVDRYFRIWTAPLEEGYYDLALIVVPDPDQTQRELPYFTTARLTTRASVYVGDEAETPTLDYPLLDPTPAADSGFGELLWFGQEPHRAGLRSAQSVTAGETVTLTVNYQPYAGSLADDTPPGAALPVALVAILDNQVVPINDQPVLYGSALPGHLSYVPVTIQVPREPGVHQLFIQQFPNPYVDAKLAEETGSEFFGDSSQRFILDVN